MEYGIIVVDNASASDTKELLESAKAGAEIPFTLIRNEKNLGFVKAINQGILASKARYLCLLNNDTAVTKGWLKEMIETADSSPAAGIINPSSNNFGQKPAAGESIEAFADKLRVSGKRAIEMATAAGFCMLIRREVIEKVGLFDEIYGMGNFEVMDFGRRSAKAGFRSYMAVRAYVWHRENSSFKLLKDFESGFQRNREIYEFRWGKPRRSAYVLDRCDGNAIKRFEMDSLRLARDGNWIHCFFTGSPKLPEHTNIAKIQLDRKWFYPNVLFRILKKKKKFDEIFVRGEKFGKVLESLSFIHKASIRYY
jgi:GT2 family glycosyltransferase